MKKSLLLIFLFSLLYLLPNKADAQISSTAPGLIFGLSLNGNFATNDFYGTNDTYIRAPRVNDYSAMWGRGASIYGKFGLGQRRTHAITTEIEFNQMLHNNSSGETFLMQNPDAPHTFYHILSGMLGYEHRFYARCREKFTMGGGLTVNNIITPSYSSIRFADGDSKTKVGIQLTAGYELVLDAANKWGLRIGARYHVLNPFDTSDEEILVLDQPKEFIGDWGRKLGVLSLNIGLVMYSGY